jgi:hypothetical protein
VPRDKGSNANAVIAPAVMFMNVRLCIVLALAGIPPEAPYHV